MWPRAEPSQQPRPPRRRKAPAKKVTEARVEGSLRVVGLAGPLCTISVDLGATTVFEAQKMIAKSAGIPTQEQQLISHNRGLSRHEILGKALGESDEVTLLRRDSKSLAVESAKITGALALERARRMAMQRGSNIQNAA